MAVQPPAGSRTPRMGLPTPGDHHRWGRGVSNPLLGSRDPGPSSQAGAYVTNIRGYWRRAVGVASLIGGATIAACSSSTAPGPSSASLARLFDSAYVADSTAQGPGSLRPIVENYLALMADEGLTPVTVLVKTDGGTLPMRMMAALSYDTTATGLAADSVALAIGWTSDYSKYLVVLTEAVTPNGPRVSGASVIPGPAGALALEGAHRRIHTATAIASLMPIVFLADGQPPISPTPWRATSCGPAPGGVSGSTFRFRPSM